ncbi:hypothetical protein PPERSA_05817 [Pseudocohnilembus persalinus]|uniref:EF-hand domain-containing protein n=1 Tax=Pseudocohnilembus persalinus TaxID=266149 RepID=A0A0V0QG88_PSEPJ|nr:hypothetical protein PPERSA_05817 [Pseudocohnilembus persalinus]|eukprot:KRX01231.1 hypothetical protein PPERSA_05817 [Pseudocohnilembus persalinus]
MLTNFAFILNDLLLIEKELEKCKIELLEQEDFSYKKALEFFLNYLNAQNQQNIEEFASIFKPLSIKGRKQANDFLYQKDVKQEISEITLIKIGKVFKMTFDSLSYQEHYNQLLFDKMTPIQVLFQYIDIHQKGKILADDLLNFLSKYFFQNREFDTKFDIEEVQLLLSKYDKLGYGFLLQTNLDQAFLPKKLYSRYHY